MGFVVVVADAGGHGCGELAEDGEETLGFCRILDGGDDARGAAAAGTDQDLGGEGAAEELAPLEARGSREEIAFGESRSMGGGDHRKGCATRSGRRRRR